jgi:hypothetical protein
MQRVRNKGAVGVADSSVMMKLEVSVRTVATWYAESHTDCIILICHIPVETPKRPSYVRGSIPHKWVTTYDAVDMRACTGVRETTDFYFYFDLQWKCD